MLTLLCDCVGLLLYHLSHTVIHLFILPVDSFGFLLNRFCVLEIKAKVLCMLGTLITEPLSKPFGL